MGTSYTQPVNSYPLPPQQQYVFSGYPYQQGVTNDNLRVTLKNELFLFFS